MALKSEIKYLSPETMALGSKLKQARNKAGLSRKVLAEKIEASESTVQAAEKGLFRVRMALVQNWANACGFEFHWDLLPKGDDAR